MPGFHPTATTASDFEPVQQSKHFPSDKGCFSSWLQNPLASISKTQRDFICSSQDMLCKERGLAKRVSAPGGSLLLLLEHIPLTLMGAQCVWELWKKLHQTGPVAVIGHEAGFLCSVF